MKMLDSWKEWYIQGAYEHNSGQHGQKWTKMDKSQND